mgnify:FL=1
MAIDTKNCCNFCKNATLKAVGFKDDAPYNLYCNCFPKPKMVDLSVPRDAYVETPIWCPMKSKTDAVHTTQTKTTYVPLSYQEKVSLMYKIKPQMLWDEIKENTVYHIPQIPGEERKDIFIVRKNQHSLTYREIGGAQNVLYTLYPSSLAIRFIVKHKIKEFKPINK